MRLENLPGTPYLKRLGTLRRYLANNACYLGSKCVTLLRSVVGILSAELRTFGFCVLSFDKYPAAEEMVKNENELVQTCQ